MVLPHIRRATPDDWADVRAIRLLALAEAPYAFASNLAAEEPLPAGHWQEWPAKHAVFLAWSDAHPVAIAVGIPGDAVELISVWTHPSTRGTGLATAMITTVVEWAEGSTRINAWAVENNPRALRFYERLGFTRTGETMAYPNDPTLTEYQLSLFL
ncbi:GNAT family N-acetyltransferase [Actinokineospora sp. NBRC 105648]|uniref:GNAT family N-acetyltransferase n=1 Tax=Actinokineospora sp. NBRC 105648 TaxID=3032206 RepID=UPI0024A1704C|nr:GNAT family N-acetyltransferase [Actinokineospora sp. NBRC 105648]GLZ43249.1 N-acetyltransferase [Actinokineospora sp. NBRC 105648]